MEFKENICFKIYAYKSNFYYRVTQQLEVNYASQSISK